LIVNTKTRARTRHIAVVAGVLSVSVAMTGCGSTGDTPAGGDGEIVVSSYGGSFQEAQQDALFTPFQEESGIAVTGTEGTGFDPLKAQIDAGDVTWDVVSLESAPFANAVNNGLLEPLDYDVIDATGVDPAVVNDYGIGYIQFSTNLVWNKDLTDEITPEEFFDPSIKLARALPRVVTSTL
jgi:putative spermidine/putrescine transport system substrate-binding protein